MTTTRDLAFTPAVALARLYRRRAVSPLEVVQAALARIDALNPGVNAFVTLVREEALREARRAVSDAALMLSVMAGPDPRSPISYEVDTRALRAAAQTPSVKGWRIAWPTGTSCRRGWSRTRSGG